MKKSTFILVLLSIGFTSIKTLAQTISAGTAHTAVICSNDSSVRAWGANGSGQLGVNDTIQQNTAVKVLDSNHTTYLKGVKAIVIRENFSLALMYDSTVWAWGFNGDGELGINDTINSWLPKRVHGPGNVGYLTGIVQISAGYAHALALKSDGSVWAWGDNTNGELGDNTTTKRLTPVQVHGLSNVGFLTGVTSIAAGQQFNLALTGTNVLAWGLDTNGELGDNSKMDQHVPVQVHGPGNVGFLTGITAIAAGGQHALALKVDSTVWSWGFNINGELGDNTLKRDSLPAQVHGPGNVGFLKGITAIKAGDYFSGAIKADSTVWAWGFNHYGQLGQGDTNQGILTPVEVHDSSGVKFLHGIVEIALGDEHLIAKKSDGTYWATGWNKNGQLGDDTTADSWVPDQVVDPCGAILGISEVKGMGKISIYPNPASNSITINCGENTARELKIYNTLGQQVYSSTSPLLSVESINVASFAPGVYLAQLYTNTGLIQSKFIVQK